MVFVNVVIVVVTLALSTSYAREQRKCATCQIKLDLSVCYSIDGVQETETPVECQPEPVCNKNFTISFIELKPYSTELVKDLLERCCGSSINVTQPLRTLKRVSDIPSPKASESNFIFPVLGHLDTKELFEYKFIPLIEVPPTYYICNKQDDLMQQLIRSCISMWPLMLICFLMTIISGFICWLIETWNNKDDFPRRFVKGWFEGFWWSYISLTTVGYGDKIPKSFCGRLFAVVWIFVGITIFTLVTAMLTAEITKYNSLPPPSMTGAKVGVIRHRLYESTLVARHGGILVDVESEDVTAGIIKLVSMLERKSIDGFVLDTYSLLVFQHHFSVDPRYQHVLDYIHTRTTRTEFLHSVNRYAYGALVRDREDYNFLKDFVTYNRDVIHTCNNLLINNYSLHKEMSHVAHPLFSTDGILFWPLFGTLMVIVLGIFGFGFVYELYVGQESLESLLCRFKKLKGTKQENFDSVESIRIR